MIKTEEEIQRIVDKWRPILEGPKTPLSACKVMLIEPQTQWVMPEIKKEEI
jgi:hypothetical protein